MAPSPPTILFAGGGTGGHVFPNVAILERLRAIRPDLRPHFLVSNRPLDAQLMQQNGLPFTAIPVRPLSSRPWHWPGFLAAWSASVKQVRQLIERENIVAIVVTGGFVSGPAVAAGRKAGVPVALVNLDAVPGKANRMMARRASAVFKVYDSPQLAGERIGLPLRACVMARPAAAARRELGLDPGKPTLLLTGASQGAASMNDMMLALVRDPATRPMFDGHQVLHLTGGKADVDQIAAGYRDANVPAVVLPFLETMGLAWGAATVAISRAGAGSVAEVWANAVPAIFMPYPYHKDQHQKLNARPLVDLGGGLMIDDAKTGDENARRIAKSLRSLLTDDGLRRAMIDRMHAHAPADGAATVARWLAAAAAR